jgi:DNA-binding beta-propeller fold protein YncE
LISIILYIALSRIIIKLLNDDKNTSITVAGTGTGGFAPNMLLNPQGIFVDTNFDLYVADYYNDRIQLFRLGEQNGITIAGDRSKTIIITLRRPTGIILDADKYLFIVDSNNHRIIGSDSNGFRCLVGCSASSGLASNQLNNPFTLRFDSYGNIFVTDSLNNRIQKFVLLIDSTNLSNSTNSTDSSNKCESIYTNQPFWTYSFLILVFLPFT